MDTILAEIEDIEQRMAAEGADLEALNTELDAILTRKNEFEARQLRDEELRNKIANAKTSRPAPTTENRKDDELETGMDRRAIAKEFTSSDAFRRYRDEGGLGTGKGVRMEFGTIETRDLISTISAPLTQTTRLPGIVESVADRPLRIVDEITTVRIKTNAFEYVRDNSDLPQGNAAEVNEGEHKPESTYKWELVEDTAKAVAHYTDVTRQALDDENQLQDLIKGRLFYGLGYRVDGQIVNGTGAAGTLKGILSYSTINQHTPGSAEAKVISLRRAKTLVRKDEYAANLAVLAPEDWETIELSTDDTGRWRVTPNVQENLTARIWGMRVVETNTINTGTALIGDFKLGVTLYDRQQANLALTDSDGEKFQFNILTMRAELRVGLALNRPSAMCKVTFNGAE